MGILLKNGDTKTVESIDVSGVIIPSEGVNSMAHLIGRFIGESHAKNVAGENAKLVNQICKTVRESSGFT